MLVDKLLESWTDKDIKIHFSNVRKFYFDRREIMRKAIEKHFTGSLILTIFYLRQSKFILFIFVGIAEWSVPKGGMFFWVKITVMDDVYDVIMNKCIPQGVFAVPGHAFYPDNTKPCPYIRLSYSETRLDDFDRVSIAKESTITYMFINFFKYLLGSFQDGLSYSRSSQKEESLNILVA